MQTTPEWLDDTGRMRLEEWRNALNVIANLQTKFKKQRRPWFWVMIIVEIAAITTGILVGEFVSEPASHVIFSVAVFGAITSPVFYGRVVDDHTENWHEHPEGQAIYGELTNWAMMYFVTILPGIYKLKHELVVPMDNLDQAWLNLKFNEKLSVGVDVDTGEPWVHTYEDGEVADRYVARGRDAVREYMLVRLESQTNYHLKQLRHVTDVVRRIEASM